MDEQVNIILNPTAIGISMQTTTFKIRQKKVNEKKFIGLEFKKLYELNLF